MPADHGRQRLDHHQRADARLGQRRLRGVAQAEPGHDHIETRPGGRSQPEPGELDLGHGEQAGHQELVAELDLVDLDVEGKLTPPAQAQATYRRRLVIELLEQDAHAD